MRLINPCFHFHIFILWFAIQSDNVDNKNVNDKIAFEECFRVHRVRRERPCRKNFFNYRRSSHKRSSDLENDLFPLDGGDAQRYDDKRTLGLFEKEGLLRLGTISRFNFTIIINYRVLLAWLTYRLEDESFRGERYRLLKRNTLLRRYKKKRKFIRSTRNDFYNADNRRLNRSIIVYWRKYNVNG